MRARVPQDVDLEDKLIFGLSPVRFGYLVIAVLGAFTVWGLHVLPGAVRLFLCLLILLAGPVLAWGRVGGTRSDRLAWDCLVFLRRNRQLEFGLRRARQAADTEPAAADSTSAGQDQVAPARLEGRTGVGIGLADGWHASGGAAQSAEGSLLRPKAGSSAAGVGRELDLRAINRLAAGELAA